MRDYYWTDKIIYYIYTQEIEKKYGEINFFNNLFDGEY
jgi:hypothetical protein